MLSEEWLLHNDKVVKSARNKRADLERAGGVEEYYDKIEFFIAFASS